MFKTLLILLFYSQSLWASIGSPSINYRTKFGQCPAKTTGDLAIELVTKFEETKSLAELKKYIIDQKLKERYYLSSYQVNYNPLNKKLELDFDCPKIIARVQVFKKDGSELYNAILVDTGEIIDPNYEVFLRKENKLDHALPFLSLPYQNINDSSIARVSEYLVGVDIEVKSKISEIILDKKENLTLIISNNKNAVSVFMGQRDWFEKTKKLSKTLNYFEGKSKLPSIIKFTSSKKIVVKFSHNL